MDFETFAEKYERKYYCNILTAVAVGAAGALASTAASSLLGGSGGSSGGGGGSSLPSYNGQPANIVAQPVPTQQQSTAASSAYNPTKDADNWTSIFTDFAHNSTPDKLDLPSSNAGTQPNIQAGS